MMNEGRLDEGKMSCARAWKVSIVLTAAVACLSILHSSFYNVSSDRFFSSTKSTSFREAKTTPASRSDDSKLAKSGSALVDSGSVMMATTYKSMCVHIGSQSAFSLWKLHAAQILKASQLPADPQFAQHDMMLEMLNKISPRLPHSHQSLTRAWKTVEHVLSVAWERYQYLQHIKNPVTSTLQKKEPPLVRIVVVGGSVTLGHKCSAINDVKEIPCSWVARLETLLNGLAGGALVQVHNSAIGASTSETGQAIWDHEILPDEAKNPDILINAYSTNDSHPSRGTRDKKSAMAQSFVRSILTPLTCSKPPLLIWLDDYIGNVAQGIKEMTLLSQEVQVLANYYGFSFVSFANVVRDWVYGDNHGTLFTPPWYSADGQFVTEVHPGQGMHIATMWIMAYNFLNLATTHCSVVNWSSQTNHNSAGSSFMHPFNTSDQIKIPESTYYQPVPSSLPPALTDALTLKDVTDMWRNDARALEKNPKVCSPNRTSRCIFSWVSGLEWQESIATIQKKFAPFVVEQGKWRVIDDTGRRKFGWVPAEKGSKLLFEFQNLTQTVRTVTLFPMKSYGEKWRNSNARFRFLSKSNEAMDWLELTSLEIPGLHSTTTSEIYTIPVHMPSEIPANSNLRISMTMTNGTTYKLMGLTVCS